MSVKLSSMLGNALTRALEVPSQSRVQAPTAPTPAVTPASTPAVSIPGSTDAFETVSKAQKEWESKFAEVVQAIAPELEQLAPLETKSLKNLANSVNESRNVVAGDQHDKGKWSSSTPVLQQSEDSNCGAAAAAMLTKSKGGKEGVSGKELMDDLGSRYGTKDGTTPKEMAKMLANEGIAVKGSSTTADKTSLESTLKSGGKAVAMVDSNEISSKGGAQAPGKAHWVVIDGMDDQGRFMVKDPGSASSYFVKGEELNKAIDTGRNTHQSGGVLLLENEQAPETVPVAEQEAEQKAEALGDTPGTGSMASRFGRESS
ncbi:C39 family peptidase [Archangium violaceum]|uniref:C39 family peptidase n=1 Tax=Archangium violaceum TaxID=83451 RepID=UPI0036D8D6A1